MQRGHVQKSGTSFHRTPTVNPKSYCIMSKQGLHPQQFIKSHLSWNCLPSALGTWRCIAVLITAATCGPNIYQGPKLICGLRQNLREARYFHCCQKCFNCVLSEESKIRSITKHSKDKLVTENNELIVRWLWITECGLWKLSDCVICSFAGLHCMLVSRTY